MEPIVAGIASNLLTAGLVRGGAEIRQQRLNALRKAEFGNNLDTLATDFNRALRDAIEEFDAKRDTNELAGVTDDWGAVARELYNVDGEEAANLDVESAMNRLSFENKEDAVEQVAESIAAANGYNLASTPQLERDLKRAVTIAFGDAINKFAERISDSERADAFLTEAAIESLEEIHDLRKDLDNLAERFEAPKFYEKFDIPEDSLNAVSKVIEPQKIEFAERPEIKGRRDFERLLLVGPGGSGKSRAMAELVATYECDISHVVIPRESLTREDHLARLRRESFEGNVLLVWDDIHAISPERDNVVFRDAVSQLEKEILGDDHELRVLAAARTEALNTVPGDPRKDDDPLWSAFDVADLHSLQFDVLANIFGYALIEHEVEISEEVAKLFLQKAIQTDPSPLYVTSVVQTAEGGQLTEDDVEELPKDAFSVWQDQYRDIKTANDERRFILLAVKLLDALKVPMYRSLLKGLYVEVLNRKKSEFNPPIDELVERQWLIPANDKEFSESWYEVHDVKREAINEEIDEWLWDLSDFLRENIKRYLPKDDDVERALHINLGTLAPESSAQQSAKMSMIHYEYAVNNIDSDDALPHYNLGNLFYKNVGDFEKAADHYEQAIDINPHYSEAHYNYALILHEEWGNSTKAAKHYEQAIDSDPYEEKAHFNLAVILHNEMNEFEKAAEHYERAIQANPSLGEAHYNYAHLLDSELENPELAAKHYKRAINAGVPEANYNYADILKKRDRPWEAAQFYEQAINHNSANIKAHYNYANLLKNSLEQPLKAAHHYERAIDIDPEDPEPHCNYANLLFTHMNKPQKASEHYEKAIDINPDYGKAHFNYGNLLLKQYRRPKASKMRFERAVDCWIDDGHIRNAIVGLRQLISVCRVIGADDEIRKRCVQALNLLKEIGYEDSDDTLWFERMLEDYDS